MKREYHEIYGWMPQSVINHISEEDRRLLFLQWVTREPSPIGWYIVSTTVKELGEEFIEYVFRVTYESLLEDGEVTKEDLEDNVKTLFASFATDLNSFAQFIGYYFEDTAGDSESDDNAEDTWKHQPRDSKGRFTKKQK